MRGHHTRQMGDAPTSALHDARPGGTSWERELGQLKVSSKSVLLTMQTIGSRSLSPGTSIHVISMASGSPGEQGVSRSSTICPGVVRDGPWTCNRDMGELVMRKAWEGGKA